MVDRIVRALSFGSEADVYESVRPLYPARAVGWVLEPVSGRHPLRIADVGAGTGKLTRVLREVSDDVVAVDPDIGMLGKLVASVPGVEVRQGKGESLPLSDASRDAVVFGQSWHWTDPALASREVARVLRTGGVLGLLWNVRDTAVPWVARYTDIMRGSDSERMIARRGVRIGAPFVGVEEAVVPWVAPTTRVELLDLARSRSHFITASDSEKARIVRESEALFDELGFSEEETVELPYVTHCYRAVLIPLP